MAMVDRSGFPAGRSGARAGARAPAARDRPAPGATAAPGAWVQRPPGVPSVVPPPSVPLAFLAAAALGLIACGLALVWVRSVAVLDPTDDRVVAAAHLGMLATLSMGVLGALHQFVPVLTQRPLRSIRLAHATFASWFAGAWLLPAGFLSGDERVVEAGGGFAALAVALLVANLLAPLRAPGGGAPVTGLRFAVAGFVLTASFGVLYVADRRGEWFVLSGHVVLAHASVGLLAWLGLAYVSVAEKLWPMFFLAHVPGRRRAGSLAVSALPAGVALLSPGLLLDLPVLAGIGGAVALLGLVAHLASLIAHVRHRRRRADLHLAFVLTSALWLLGGAGLALAAALRAAGGHRDSAALASAAIAAFGGWLLETLVGHAHKVVPFIAWSLLRARGIDKNASGSSLMFADLYSRRLAGLAYALVTVGIGALCAGLATSAAAAVALSGALVAATGIVAGANLSLVPARMLLARSAPAVLDGPIGR